MPDLMKVMTHTCPSNFSWSKTVQGSTGRYLVAWNAEEGWSCTCWGFRSHKHCKHVDAVDASGERCGWAADAFANTIYHEETCPNCGEDTVPFYVGV